MQNNPWGQNQPAETDPYATHPLRPSGDGGGGPGRWLTGVLVAALLVMAGLNGNLGSLQLPALPTLRHLTSQLSSLAQQVTGTPTPAATSQPAATSTPSSPDENAIKQVIQQANDEQAQAFSSGDPTVMQDTATPSYYQQMVQTNQGLSGQGVTAISLVKLVWGPITVTGSSATATTTETWSTTLNDGTTERDTDQNVYSLVQQNGTWKVQDDQHPDDTSNPSGGTSPLPQIPPLPSIPLPIPVLPGSGTTSQNWAGYSTTGGGTYSAVTGTWVVPQPGQASDSGSGFGTDAEWVGIGGVHSRDLIQAGTEATTVSSGHVAYDAWMETLPQTARTVALSVNPGDTVAVSLSSQDGTSWDVQITDSTTGQSFDRTIQYQSSESSAEWVLEAPSATRGRQLPLDDFGNISFTDASTVKNGQSIDLQQAGAKAITMVDGTGQVVAKPTSLGSDGASFQVNQSSTPSVSPGSGPGSGSGSGPSSGPGRPRRGNGGGGGNGNGNGGGGSSGPGIGPTIPL